MGLNATVKAQSIILPEKTNSVTTCNRKIVQCYEQGNKMCTIYVSSKIKFHNIVILKHCLVPTIRRPVCSYPRKRGREKDIGVFTLFRIIRNFRRQTTKIFTNLKSNQLEMQCQPSIRFQQSTCAPYFQEFHICQP